MPTNPTVIHRLASAFDAHITCKARSNQEWAHKHRDTIETICKGHLPSGSGFDGGTTLDFDKSTSEKLVFRTAFHHMGEHGGYDGWTEHDVIVTPSFVSSVTIRVTGRNQNDIKDYIGEMFHDALLRECEI